MRRFLDVALLAGSILISAPALAGGLIGTAALWPGSGAVGCSIANVSTKPVDYTVVVYGYDGVPILGPTPTLTLGARQNTMMFGAPYGVQGHCVVEVLSGSKKALRVAAVLSNGSPFQYALPGQ